MIPIIYHILSPLFAYSEPDTMLYNNAHINMQTLMNAHIIWPKFWSSIFQQQIFSGPYFYWVEWIFNPSIPGSFNEVCERQIRKLTRQVQSCNHGRSKVSSSKVLNHVPSRNMASLTDLRFDFHRSVTLVSWLKQWKILKRLKRCCNFCSKLVYIATIASEDLLMFLKISAI